jgi:hypothetical protein
MRFILLAHERTGTTVFRGLVNQHPSVFIYGEMCFPSFFDGGWYSHLADEVDRDKSVLLPRERGARFFPYLSQLAEKEERGGKNSVGFDVKIEQTGMIGYFNHTAQQSAYGILHVRRTNTLAAIISNVTMEARMNRGLPPHDTKPADNEPVYLDPEWLKLRIEEHELQDRQVTFTHKNQPYLQIHYEEFTSPTGWRITCNRLSGFFNFVFEVPFNPPYVKQNTSNLAELISNADEIRRRFARFFET